MKPEKHEVLSEVFIDIAEKFAFMFGERVSNDELPEVFGDELIGAHLKFTGVMCGTLDIAVPAELCRELAGNVLGLTDDALTPSASLDSVKELLNVTCGNLLSSLAGNEPVFEVSSPEAGVISTADWDKMLENSDTLCFNVDENPVLLRLSICSSEN